MLSFFAFDNREALLDILRDCEVREVRGTELREVRDCDNSPRLSPCRLPSSEAATMGLGIWEFWLSDAFSESEAIGMLQGIDCEPRSERLGASST